LKSADELCRLRIEVSGVVQGVGFLPFVFRIAGEIGVTGWVCNYPQGAVIKAGGSEERVQHTEMFSDGVVDLIVAGVVTNRLKNVHRGRRVISFVSGSRRLFDFVNDNPSIDFHPCDRTNDTAH
jgi:acylphosphatase